MDIVKGQPLTLPNGDVLLPEPDETGSTLLSKDEIDEREELENIENEIGTTLDDIQNVLDNLVVTRTLADVNLPFEQMNVFMLVTAYKLWGLNSFAIGKLLNVAPERIDNMLSSEVHDELRLQLAEAIRAAETATVHGYLAQHAITAATTIVAGLRNKSADIRVATAKDVLDRAGFRPVDRVEHSMKFEDELRIRIIRDEAEIPTINLEAGE